jgi:hypothetical protein
MKPRAETIYVHELEGPRFACGSYYSAVCAEMFAAAHGCPRPVWQLTPLRDCWGRVQWWRRLGIEDSEGLE